MEEDSRQTKLQLINELEKLRQRVADIEQSEVGLDQAKDGLSIVYDAIDSTVGGIIITDPELSLKTLKF